jgi:microcystin-dependent protein
MNDLAPLINGHPILMIQNSDDLAAFDSNGNGTGDWIKWAACDGNVHNGITTPDLRDRFVVGSGLSYTVNTTGGEISHTLTVAEMPAHTHTVTDPGHLHTIDDPGHTHPVTDSGHTHAASQIAHSHSGTTSTTGSHHHAPASDPGNAWVTSDNNGTYLDGSGPGIEVNDSDGMADAGDHSHTVTTDSATPAISIESAYTGVSISSNTAGINSTNSNVTGISIGSAGGGAAHENRPPYYSVMFIMKVA